MIYMYILKSDIISESFSLITFQPRYDEPRAVFLKLPRHQLCQEIPNVSIQPLQTSKPCNNSLNSKQTILVPTHSPDLTSPL